MNIPLTAKNIINSLNNSLDKAATSLVDDITKNGRPDWFHTVGFSANELFIYTKEKQTPKLPDVWQGFPVKVRYLGKIEVNTL